MKINRNSKKEALPYFHWKPYLCFAKRRFHFQILGFRYFEFLFIYERIPNRIRIRTFGIFVLALVIRHVVLVLTDHLITAAATY